MWKRVIRVFFDFLDESRDAFAVLLRPTVEVAPEMVGVAEVQTRCPTILFVFYLHVLFLPSFLFFSFSSCLTRFPSHRRLTSIWRYFFPFFSFAPPCTRLLFIVVGHFCQKVAFGGLFVVALVFWSLTAFVALDT